MADSSMCFLCAAAASHAASLDNLVVGASAHAIAMLNKYPYTSGHLMVVPRRHVCDFSLMADHEYSDVMNLVRRSIDVVANVYAPHGCNVGVNLGSAAGAGAPDHVHIHVVPRWEGDTSFMSVLSDTRVISEDLETTWRKVSQQFMVQ